MCAAFGSNPKGLLVGACTNNFNFNTAIFSAAFGSFVVRYWLLLAFTFGVDTVFLNTFRHQVGLDSLRALN